MSKIYKRLSISENLDEYCYIANDHNFMEITEWKNGEGVDVYINSEWSERHIALTWGELELLVKLSSIIQGSGEVESNKTLQ